jgi:hypothetical protein
VPQVLAIRTSTLEEKATACNMIVCYLDELKEGFFPYVQEVRRLGGYCATPSTPSATPSTGLTYRQPHRSAPLHVLFDGGHSTASCLSAGHLLCT